MTMKYKIALPMLAVVALIAGFSLLTRGQAQADDDGLEVTGSYDTVFTKFDDLLPGPGPDGFLHLDNAIEGTFELTIGDDPRTGRISFAHYARFDPVAGSGTIHGRAAWMFDDGPTCVGFLAGPIVGGDFHGAGDFGCSDGSTLSVETADTDVAPGPGGHARADISGELLTDDDDDED